MMQEPTSHHVCTGQHMVPIQNHSSAPRGGGGEYSTHKMGNTVVGYKMAATAVGHKMAATAVGHKMAASTPNDTCG